MPRGPRLDAPAALHHVIARGIERAAIFLDHDDCEDFIRRTADLAKASAITVYAFALVANHFHLLVRTGSQPLSRSMRSLLSGYAGRFNRRHGRAGHLFQNRFRSIVCEEERYFLELVRYIHLNPLRAGLVAGLDELNEYPYCGQSAILGRCPRDWMDSELVLAQFAPTVAQARKRYTSFVAAGVEIGRRPDLVGGGLVRSVGGWEEVKELRRGRERYSYDERILGGTSFVQSLKREASEGSATASWPSLRGMTLLMLLDRVCGALNVEPQALCSRELGERSCQAREAAAFLWVEMLGKRSRDLALAFGAHDKSIYRMARRGRRKAATWARLLA